MVGPGTLLPPQEEARRRGRHSTEMKDQEEWREEVVILGL
jgi:hypothetical protein